MVILRIGALSKSAYERMQHLPLARKAGWTDEEIGKLEQVLFRDEIWAVFRKIHTDLHKKRTKKD